MKYTPKNRTSGYVLRSAPKSGLHEIHTERRTVKRLWRPTIACALFLTLSVSVYACASKNDAEPIRRTQATEKPSPSPVILVYEPDMDVKAPETLEYVEPVIETAPAVRYALTDAERAEVERAVMAEASGEGPEGQKLVAQCILNAAEINGIRPDAAIRQYQYSGAAVAPSDEVKESVSAVFDDGETVTDEPIVWFYNPDVVYSGFHESQRYVLTSGNHKFFAPWEVV